MGTGFLVGLVCCDGPSAFPDRFFPEPRSVALGRSTRCSGGSVPEAGPRLELRRRSSGVGRLDDLGLSEGLEERSRNLAEVQTTASGFDGSSVEREQSV